MRTSVTVLTLCVYVCPPFSGSIKRLYNTLITEIGFLLNAKDFQLTDFSEKASFESYSLFCSFYGMAAILFCWYADSAYWRTLLQECLTVV